MSFSHFCSDEFDFLVRHHWNRLWKHACRLCHGDIHDAGDLLSEGLIDAFRSFRNYRGYGFDRWLLRILSANRIDMIRRTGRRQEQSLEETTGGVGLPGPHSNPPPEVADGIWDPERRLLRHVYSEAVQAALDDLPETFRAAVLLCDVERLEYQEIADILGLPVGTVRSRVHRARARLRDRLTGARLTNIAGE